MDRLAAGAPRAAIWRRLMEKWRAEAAKYPDERTCSASEAYEECADELEIALRACAEAPETKSEAAY